MKSGIKVLCLLLFLFIGALIKPQIISAQGVSVSMQVFYDELSPYGTWVYSPDYGYVWLPDVDPGFSPYATNGYWVFTNDGWAWVSYYPWGWAPFHYGRWYTDPYYGPMWVPDYDWGPGWVTWRRSGDYYGWAPIGPGVTINVAYSNGYYVPNDHWTYVRGRDFGRRDINNYYIDNSTNVTIINNSTVINNVRVDKTQNVTYNAGPERNEVEKHAGKSITPVTIVESNTPGQNLTDKQLKIYKPQVQKNAPAGQKPAPSKVVELKDVKPSLQKTGETQQQKVNQPEKQQPPQQHQKTGQPEKQQPQQQHQKTGQPEKQQPPQQHQKTGQPEKQQPQKQQQKTGQPDKQQQPQQIDQPDKQQQSEPQKDNPSKTPGKEKPPKQTKPPKNNAGDKPPH